VLPTAAPVLEALCTVWTLEGVRDLWAQRPHLSRHLSLHTLIHTNWLQGLDVRLLVQLIIKGLRVLLLNFLLVAL